MYFPGFLYHSEQWFKTKFRGLQIQFTEKDISPQAFTTVVRGDISMETEPAKVKVLVKNTKSSLVLSAGSVRTGDWVWSLSHGFMYFKSEWNLKTFLRVGIRAQEKVRNKGTHTGEDKIKTEREQEILKDREVQTNPYCSHLGTGSFNHEHHSYHSAVQTLGAILTVYFHQRYSFLL